LSPDLRLALTLERAGLALGRKPPVTREAQEGCLQALDQLLVESKAGGRATVSLSHHHARLFLLPPPAVRLRQREMQPWLLAQLGDALGNGDTVAADWRLTWDRPVPGQPILVAAAETRLLDGLAATLGRHGLGLAGIQPWLAAAWRRRRHLARGNGWYAMLEPGRMTLLRLRGGRPASLRQRQVGTDVAGDLRALLARESLLAGVADSGELWIERAGVSADWSNLRASHRVQELAGPGDPVLAMLS
jgi:hypothetical protein